MFDYFLYAIISIMGYVVRFTVFLFYFNIPNFIPVEVWTQPSRSLRGSVSFTVIKSKTFYWCQNCILNVFMT